MLFTNFVLIALTTALTAVILAAMHFAVRTATYAVRYAFGTLALLVPYSILLIYWGAWLALVALWPPVVIGGATVLYLYNRDYREATEDQAEIIKALHEQVKETKS